MSRRVVCAASVAAAVAVWCLAGPGHAAVIVTMESAAPASSSFNTFPTIPPLSATDIGNQAPGGGGTATLIEGSLAGGSGPVTLINNGAGQTKNDDPGNSVFFANQGGAGPMGRIALDLGALTELTQVNTYSWHNAERAPQVYDLYAAANPSTIDPTSVEDGGDPTAAGYTLLASVDDHAVSGTQRAVSVTDDSGTLGTYRYLLFVVKPAGNPFGSYEGTFYSEFDAVGTPAVPEPASLGLLGLGAVGLLTRRRR